MNTKTKKRILVGVLVLAAALFALRPWAFSSERPAKAAEIESVQKYLVVTAPFLEGRELTAQDFEDRCSASQENERVTIYSLDGSGIVVPEAERIVAVSQINAFALLEYNAKDGKEVKLVYSDQGLYEYGVYDPKSDQLILKFGEDDAVLHRNFREGKRFLWF